MASKHFDNDSQLLSFLDIKNRRPKVNSKASLSVLPTSRQKYKQLFCQKD
jgi:hypothetical protein